MPRNASENVALPTLDYETWKELVRAMGGRFNPEGIDPKAFIGWLRPMSVFGLTAAEVSSNAQRVERTQRDVRLDGADHYIAIFQVAGQSALTHNEQALRCDVGDVVLVDVARPATFFASVGAELWKSVALLLPRRSLISHLGFEPRGGLYRRGGTAAGRLLLDLIRNPGEGGGSAHPCANSHMRLAVYDLVGALFAPVDPAPSRHADKLFMRVRSIIKDGFADPDLCPDEAAARAGISLRYLQKLSRSAARPAVNSSIRSVLIRPHVFCIARRSWPQINTSARLLTLAAFAATHISREGSDTGSVTHQVHVPQDIFALGSGPNERVPSELTTTGERLAVLDSPSGSRWLPGME